ncbi:hypothetical protein K438DRAFT_1754778 [Mycena galopus ATCC 62051]|nr:hypothetical protein K438DRAFT_1754778 [Mycena galopus ATCC 62051]
MPRMYVLRPRAHGEAFEVDVRKRGVGADSRAGQRRHDPNRRSCQTPRAAWNAVLSNVTVSTLELFWSSLVAVPDVPRANECDGEAVLGWFSLYLMRALFVLLPLSSFLR